MFVLHIVLSLAVVQTRDRFSNPKIRAGLSLVMDKGGSDPTPCAAQAITYLSNEI
jgi:hypothetical protein